MLHVSLMIILQYVGEFIFPLLGTNRLSLLGDKQVVLFREQTACPYWGTNMLSFLRDKQVALIGGQTTSPYWGTNSLPLLGDKPLGLIGGQTTWPYNEKNGCVTMAYPPIVYCIAYTCILPKGCKQTFIWYLWI